MSYIQDLGIAKIDLDLAEKVFAAERNDQAYQLVEAAQRNIAKFESLERARLQQEIADRQDALAKAREQDEADYHKAIEKSEAHQARLNAIQGQIAAKALELLKLCHVDEELTAMLQAQERAAELAVRLDKGKRVPKQYGHVLIDIAQGAFEQLRKLSAKEDKVLQRAGVFRNWNSLQAWIS